MLRLTENYDCSSHSFFIKHGIRVGLHTHPFRNRIGLENFITFNRINTIRIMSSHLLLVKNMVCHRCIMAVEAILTKHDVPYHHVTFGEIHLTNEIAPHQKEAIATDLNTIGFELIDSHVNGLIEKIKLHVLQKARNEVSEEERALNLSSYLAEKLHYEYTYLSSLFSSIEGRTIENLYIEQRIEKAKEFLIYGQMTLSEIALELEYSSTAHLSSQFKKVTGLTPSHFKQIGNQKRQALDQV